jgi:hypothetical protein
MASRVASSTATATLTKQVSANQAIASRAAYHSTTSTTQSSSQQIPNRFTQAFQEMKEVCPNSISIYASCVLETERSGHSISQHSCSKEFRHVKDCFRKVRGF